ncbi:hypothetical protein FA95DRAFT_1611668 [Auriscalpium vulgare]|uniref:Uncharacterized protein n=1 Tax=Auriscalpium vulgare TaxID=40419 RepID=A0ACB8R9Z3_9AGAM|nr:hypothetical protein FA95DRAFT_1611668 [Auriscalpium vulgare]
MRAYTLWRAGHGLLDICVRLRSAANPLQESTVITYVVQALERDPGLPFEMRALRALVQTEPGSWVRHRDCVARWEAERRGVSG